MGVDYAYMNPKAVRLLRVSAIRQRHPWYKDEMYDRLPLLTQLLAVGT